MRTVQIANHKIGRGQSVFIIAEIGYNFNRLEEAKASIDAAMACGVNAVKFQTFRAETLTSRYTDFPDEAGGTNQFDEFKRYELSEESHRVLFEYATQKGMVVFSTPAYYDDVELLERVGIPAYKIGSDDLTNLPFIEYIAAKRRPIIFSTGMADLSEVDEAYRTICGTGNDQIVILQCVSNYPIRDFRMVNLRVIESYRRAFDVPIGFSDHTVGYSCAVAAVSLGASVIEKHFTIDKGLDAPDAFFSADPKEMKALVQAVREVEDALGTPVKMPTPSEVKMRSETRKSVLARRKIQAGEILKPDMIIVKRPGTGIPPKLQHFIFGRHVKHNIEADRPITLEMLE